MLKRILCVILLLLMTTAALAEPRYPSQSGVATDGAAVLSAKLLEDLRTLDKRLEHADMPRIYVVTVDFLDGMDVQSYADALFQRWKLPEDAMLLLLAVGEESCAIASGRNVDRLVSPSVQQQLLNTHLYEPYLAQRYDAAVAAYVSAVVAEYNKACGTSVRTDDLFRSVSASLFDNWASTQSHASVSAPAESILTREDKGTGFSLLKVLLIVVLLVLLFGSFRKAKRAAHPYAPSRPADKAAADKPVYFKPHVKKPAEQYFKPRR